MWKLPTHQYLLSSYASRTRSCIYECVVLLANVKAACHLLQVKWMWQKQRECIVVLLVPVQSVSYQPYKCLWLIIMLWRYTKQGGFLFHPHDKCTAPQERGECTTVSNLRTAWTLLGSDLTQEVHKRFVKLTSFPSSVQKQCATVVHSPLSCFAASWACFNTLVSTGHINALLFRTFGELRNYNYFFPRKPFAHKWK